MSTTQILRGIALTAAIAFSVPLVTPTSACAQPTTKATPARKEMNSEDLYEHVLKCTCWVCLPNSFGTGWVLDREKRLIVTNHHVVDGYDDVKVFFAVKKGDRVETDPTWYLQGGTKPISGRVIDRNKHQDLSLIQLNSLPTTAAALPLSASSARQGQEIMTIGGTTIGSTGLWGCVDGKVRNVVDISLPTGKLQRVESNVSTNAGNSGGPMVNSRGELVAVHYASSPDARNVSYHVDVSELRTFLRIALPIVEPKNATGLVDRGNRRLAEGRHAKAREDYAAAVKLDPKNSRAYLGRGRASHSMGDSRSAILDLDQSIQLNPKNYLAYYYRGSAQYSAKQYESAIASLTDAIRLNAKSALSYNERGRVYLSVKKHGDAEADFGRAIALVPKQGYVWRNRALARERLGKIPEAIGDLEKGIACDPRNPLGYFRLGNLHRQAKRFEDAMTAYIKADVLDSKNPIYAEEIGRCQEFQGKYESAVKLYDLALTRSTVYKGSYKADACLCSRGYCLRQLQKYKDSLADHNNSLKINAKRAETYYQRAWTYRSMGQINLAKADYDKAVSLDSAYSKKQFPGIVRTTSGYNGGVRR